MKILLDTHVIIWALTNDERLSDVAGSLILDRNNIIYFSMASIWEIAIKSQKTPKKIPYAEEDVMKYCNEAGFEPVNITGNHIATIKKLHVAEGRQPTNNDPFDRMLLAQAKAEGMKLLTHDKNFDNYYESSILMI